MRSLKQVLFISVFIFSLGLKSQTDSATSKQSVRFISNELGVNAVGLIKQAISNNPNSTIPQLPYTLMYNLCFVEKHVLRLGIGFSQNTTKTTVTGLSSPRTVDQSTMDMRIGYGFNYLVQKQFAFNVYADFVVGSSKFKSITTSTVTTGSFPQTTSTVTSKSSTMSDRSGAEIGFGAKYNFNKHISVYTECPIVFTKASSTEKTELYSTEPFSAPFSETNKSTISNTSIILPVTIYLLFRF
jgi:hypothetical protein